MRRWLFGTVLFLGAQWTAGEELTLTRALELARQGPLLRAAAAQAAASEQRVREQQAWRWPQLEVEAQARSLRKDPGFLMPRGAFGNPVPLAMVTGERDVETGRVWVSQLLWDWQRTGLAVEAARSEAEAKKNEMEVWARKVDKATVAAFAGAWAASGELAACEKAQQAAAETLRVVTTMVAQGLLPRSDQMAAEFALQQRIAQCAEKSAALAASLAVLEELTGAQVTGVLWQPDELVRTEPERGVEGRAELRVLRAQEQALERAAAALRREALPSLILVGGVDHVRDQYYLHQTNGFAALVLKAKVFDGGQARARAQVMRWQAEALRQQREATQRAAQRELTVASAHLGAAEQALRAAHKAVEATEEEVRLETLRHREGLATTRDLLQAQEHLAQARGAVARSQAGWLIAWAEQLAACGEDFLQVLGGER
ncbi:MAG: TolC family protein [Thermoanaerobaculum sp.]|nr:TolC family protein [Thermoanaerobaculum sp.]